MTGKATLVATTVGLLALLAPGSAFAPAGRQPLPASVRAGARRSTGKIVPYAQSYQEQLARARAEKAARMAGGGVPPPPRPMPPPMTAPPARPPPPPVAPQPQQPVMQQPPPPQYQQQYQQPPPPPQYQAPPPPPPPQRQAPPSPSSSSSLPGSTQDAVAMLLGLLGERLASGSPLSPDKIQAFARAAEAVIAEGRGGGSSQQPPIQRQQPPQPQQWQQPPQPQQQEEVGPGGFYVAKGFEQDEDIPWHLGSRTLTGPQPGYKSAGAFVPSTGFDEQGDDFSQGLPQPVTRGTTGKKSPFMDSLKGTQFYVDVEGKEVTPEEYMRIIAERVQAEQQQRRQSQRIVGIEVATNYMEQLNQRKRELLRQQAQERSQQWQQEGGQQQ